MFFYKLRALLCILISNTMLSTKMLDVRVAYFGLVKCSALLKGQFWLILYAAKHRSNLVSSIKRGLTDSGCR